jgi:hypothetical protein
MDLQLAAIEKAIPSAAPRAAIARAEFQAAYHDKKTKLLSGYDTTERVTGTSVQTSSGDKSGAKGDRPTPSTDVQNFSTMQANGKIAERILELQKLGAVPTPQMRREYEQNEHLLLNRAIKESEGGAPSQAWSKVLRTVGAVPENSYPETASKLQREYLDLTTVLGHYRVFKMGGQTALASPEGRRAIMGPGQGGAGEPEEAASRKDALMATEFVEAAKRAEEVSRVGEKERKLEAQAAGKVGSPNRVRAPSPTNSNAGAFKDYEELRSSLNDGSITSTPEIIKAMGDFAESKGTNAKAARYIRGKLEGR